MRQAQKKPDGSIATPKPICGNHEEPVIMERLWKSGHNKKGTRVMKKWGWGCHICGNVCIDIVKK